jgi:hypothetical protein
MKRRPPQPASNSADPVDEMPPGRSTAWQRKAAQGLERVRVRIPPHRTSSARRSAFVAASVASLFAGPLVARSDESAVVKDSYLQGTAVLDEGDALDLDSGGVVRKPSTLDGAEIVAANGATFRRPRRISKTFAPMVAVVSDAPWSELTTDGGRQAAVQILHASDPTNDNDNAPLVVRYVVAPEGVRAWRPAPRDPHCLGAQKRIDVWFEADPTYVRYRVDRRRGPEGAFSAAGEVEHAPFIDRAVEDGVRFGYRITPVTKSGDTGVPAEVQGTTASRGVVCGSVLCPRQAPHSDKAWDLIRGIVDTSSFDLRLKGTSSVQVAFFGIDGRTIPYCAGPLRESDRPWDIPFASVCRREIDLGEPFYVPLRGGGVARAIVRREPPTAGWVALPDLRIDYVLDPDGPTIGPETRLTTERSPDGRVRVRLAAPELFVVDSIDVLGLDGAVLRSLKSDGREAFDAPPAGELRRAYRAAAHDARGRCAAPGVVVLDERPASPKSSRVEIPFHAGWSFATGAVVPLEDADFSVTRVAGGGNSVTVAASGGTATAYSLTGWKKPPTSPQDLFDAIAAVRPEGLRLAREDDADGRIPISHVFVVKCHSGGWAKLFLRERRKAPKSELSTFEFDVVFNPREPVFDAARPVLQTTGGLGLARPIVVDPWGDRMPK